MIINTLSNSRRISWFIVDVSEFVKHHHVTLAPTFASSELGQDCAQQICVDI